MAEENPASPISVPPKANPLGTPAVPHAATLKLKPIIRKPAAGATVAGLKPGLKLPPKPGSTVSGLKPGLKLPTTMRPVIRKPGEATSTLTPVTKVDMTGVAKLPTVEMQSVSREEIVNTPAPEAPKPMETLKSVTQKLKGITQPIPAQAVLHKTGIIAETADGQTDAQKQAAKSKTARISLSDAMGAAPVKDENAPMKTIRIKRPVDLPPAKPTTTLSPVKPEPEVAELEAATPELSITERRTVKIVRPTGGAVKPTNKFAIRKPGATDAEGEVADISDIPDVPRGPIPPTRMVTSVDEMPKVVSIISLIVQVAACAVIGALAWYLYTDTTILPY